MKYSPPSFQHKFNRNYLYLSQTLERKPSKLFFFPEEMRKHTTIYELRRRRISPYFVFSSLTQEIHPSIAAITAFQYLSWCMQGLQMRESCRWLSFLEEVILCRSKEYCLLPSRRGNTQGSTRNTNAGGWRSGGRLSCGWICILPREQGRRSGRGSLG